MAVAVVDEEAGRAGTLVVARVGGRGDEGAEAGSAGAGGGSRDSNPMGRAMLSSMVVVESTKGQWQRRRR